MRAARFVSEAQLVDALAAAQFRLLGERHDNGVHHALRARWIGAIAQRGKRPAVVLEPFDLEHDDALRAAQREAPDAERLADGGRLNRKGWEWPLHRPIVDAALAAGLPVRAGNLSRERLRERLQASTGSQAFADVAWDARQQALLSDEIVQGHCGKLPAEVVPRMVLGQRIRDDAMAQALVDAASSDGAILVAGNGHVRNDVGVPIYVRARVPAARIVSVGLIEVAAGSEVSASRAASEQPRYDYIVLTDAVARPDPCASIPATIGR